MISIPLGVGSKPSNILLPKALAVLSKVFKSENLTPNIVRLLLSISMLLSMFLNF